MIKKLLLILLLLPSLCFARIDYLGTTWYINADGYALTAYHIVHRMKHNTLFVYKNKTNLTNGKIVAVDKSFDLALIKVNKKTPDFISFSKNDLQFNQRLTAKGYYKKGFHTNHLIFDGTEKNYRHCDGGAAHPIACMALGNSLPGMSGGPYFDEFGSAVGLVSGGDSRGTSDFIGKPAIVSFLKRNNVKFYYNKGYSDRAIEIIEVY